MLAVGDEDDDIDIFMVVFGYMTDMELAAAEAPVVSFGGSVVCAKNESSELEDAAGAVEVKEARETVGGNSWNVTVVEGRVRTLNGEVGTASDITVRGATSDADRARLKV